jgi:hypothetical protein
MYFMHRRAGAVAAAIALCALGTLGQPSPALAHPKLDPPDVTCVDGKATQVSLTVKICGGEQGAPKGFQLQWFQGDANASWPPTTADGLCIANFGTARKGHYLAPGQCIEVSVGELIAQQSTKTTAGCSVPLTCGTTYAFKAFAKASTPYKRSMASDVAYCATLACAPPGESCTYTQGYWDNHGPVPSGNNEYTWPDSVKQAGGFTVGNVFYTTAQLQSILKQAVKGNGLVSLAHQLIAAKLNVANGADPTDIAQAITDADTLIGALVIPPVGTGFLAPATTSPLNEALTNYNEGKTGPGHCG